MTNKPIVEFCPLAPDRLVALYQKLGSVRAVEKARGVNRKFVYNLLVYGIEPASKDKRKALFLPVHAKRPRSARPVVPAFKEWWWNLPKARRDQIIQAEFKKEIDNA